MSIKLVPSGSTDFDIVCEAGTYNQGNEDDKVLFYGEYSHYYDRPVLTAQAESFWWLDANELRQIADLMDQAYPTAPTES